MKNKLILLAWVIVFASNLYSFLLFGAEFRESLTPVPKEDFPSFHLKGAEGISHKAFLNELSSPDYHGTTITKQKNISVEFGKLSQADFTKLQETYHGEKTVSYDPNRSYTLIDFLPRMVQATVGLRFNYEYYKMKNGKWRPYPEGSLGNALVSQNCWGAAYEFQRKDPKGMEVFFTYPVSEYFLDDKNTKLLRKMNGADFLALDSRERNKKLKFGDVIIARAENVPPGMRISHIATYIDDDLVFEKSDNGTDSFYRLIDMKTAFGDYAYDTLEVRRITSPPKELASKIGDSPSVHDERARSPGGGNAPEDFEGAMDVARYMRYQLDETTGRYKIEPDGFIPGKIEYKKHEEKNSNSNH